MNTWIPTWNARFNNGVTYTMRFNEITEQVKALVKWPSCSHADPTICWFRKSQVQRNVCLHFLSQFGYLFIATVHTTLIDVVNTFPIMECEMDLDVRTLVLIDKRHGKQLRTAWGRSCHMCRRAAIAQARNGSGTTLQWIRNITDFPQFTLH